MALQTNPRTQHPPNSPEAVPAQTENLAANMENGTQGQASAVYQTNSRRSTKDLHTILDEDADSDQEELNGEWAAKTITMGIITPRELEEWASLKTWNSETPEIKQAELVKRQQRVWEMGRISADLAIADPPYEIETNWLKQEWNKARLKKIQEDLLQRRHETRICNEMRSVMRRIREQKGSDADDTATEYAAEVVEEMQNLGRMVETYPAAWNRLTARNEEMPFPEDMDSYILEPMPARIPGAEDTEVEHEPQMTETTLMPREGGNLIQTGLQEDVDPREGSTQSPTARDMGKKGNKRQSSATSLKNKSHKKQKTSSNIPDKATRADKINNSTPAHERVLHDEDYLCGIFRKPDSTVILLTARIEEPPAKAKSSKIAQWKAALLFAIQRTEKAHPKDTWYLPMRNNIRKHLGLMPYENPEEEAWVPVTSEEDAPRLRELRDQWRTQTGTQDDIFDYKKVYRELVSEDFEEIRNESESEGEEVIEPHTQMARLKEESLQMSKEKALSSKEVQFRKNHPNLPDDAPQWKQKFTIPELVNLVEKLDAAGKIAYDRYAAAPCYFNNRGQLYAQSHADGERALKVRDDFIAHVTQHVEKQNAAGLTDVWTESQDLLRSCLTTPNQTMAYLKTPHATNAKGKPRKRQQKLTKDAFGKDGKFLKAEEMPGGVREVSQYGVDKLVELFLARKLEDDNAKEPNRRMDVSRLNHYKAMLGDAQERVKLEQEIRAIMEQENARAAAKEEEHMGELRSLCAKFKSKLRENRQCHEKENESLRDDIGALLKGVETLKLRETLYRRKIDEVCEVAAQAGVEVNKSLRPQNLTREPTMEDVVPRNQDELGGEEERWRAIMKAWDADYTKQCTEAHQQVDDDLLVADLPEDLEEVISTFVFPESDDDED